MPRDPRIRYGVESNRSSPPSPVRRYLRPGLTAGLLVGGLCWADQFMTEGEVLRVTTTELSRLWHLGASWIGRIVALG